MASTQPIMTIDNEPHYLDTQIMEVHFYYDEMYKIQT